MQHSWDDLRLFLAVSRLGGLSAARKAVGLSPATLGRRITALEHQTGVRLFERLQTGYRLTPAGEELLVRAEEVERAMAEVAHWQDGAQGKRSIRISAGTWTTAFLTGHFGALWSSGDPGIEFVTANARVDIGHRAADIGVRNARPEDANLAGRRIGKVCFALYGKTGTGPGAPVIGLSGDTAHTPSARWLAATYGPAVGIKGNSVHAVFGLVAAGAGISVFPCFIGDADARLERVGPVIGELTTEQWLVAHHEERHVPAIRGMLERMARLLEAHTALFAGERPSGTMDQ